MLAAHLSGRDRPYHLMMTLEWPGVLEVERLERAVRALVRRHETLRTMFQDSDGTTTRPLE